MITTFLLTLPDRQPSFSIFFTVAKLSPMSASLPKTTCFPGFIPVKRRMRSLPSRWWGWHGGDEELGGVGVRPSVRHRQQPGWLVLHIEVLVFELVPVDRVTSESVPTFKVPALVSWSSELSNQNSFLLLTCNIKFGMTRWILDPLYPNPGSPVHSCLKLSTVLWLEYYVIRIVCG